MMLTDVEYNMTKELYGRGMKFAKIAEVIDKRRIEKLVNESSTQIDVLEYMHMLYYCGDGKFQPPIKEAATTHKKGLKEALKEFGYSELHVQNLIDERELKRESIKEETFKEETEEVLRSMEC